MAAPARILNESTLLVLAQAGETLFYVSSTTIPGQLLTIIDATGSVSTPAGAIRISSIGGAQILPSSTTFIQQRYGYISLHSGLEDPNSWTIVNTNQFPDPATPVSLKGVDGLSFTTNRLDTLLVSTSRASAIETQNISSFDATNVAVQVSSLYIRDVNKYFTFINTDPRLYVDGNAKLYSSLYTGGRLQVTGPLTTLGDLLVGTNISTRTGVMAVTGDLATMSSIRNQRGFITQVGGSLSSVTTGFFLRDATFSNDVRAEGFLNTNRLSTSHGIANSLGATSSIVFQSEATQGYWRYLANEIEFVGVGVTIPSISTNAVVTTQSILTSNFFTSSLSTTNTLQEIRLGSTLIANSNGSLGVSSISANSLFTLQSIVGRETNATRLSRVAQIEMNPAGGTQLYSIPYPPNDPNPFGVVVDSLGWQIRGVGVQSAANLSTPAHSLSSQFVTANLVDTSFLATASTAFTSLAAPALTVTQAIDFRNASSFTALSTTIQNSGGSLLGSAFISSQSLTTGTISTQILQSPAPLLRFQAASTTTLSTASISSLVVNQATTSSFVLTRATLGAPLEYSSIQPYATWMQPSTFQLSAPPFQTSEGAGTFFDKVFFTAAQDATAYYSIIDPRGQSPAVLSTLHVNTVAGTGVPGGSGQAIGNVYGGVTMDSTFATYFGDNYDFWRLCRLGLNGQISTMGGRSPIFYGDGGLATEASIGPRMFVSFGGTTEHVIVSDISNVRLRVAVLFNDINTIAGTGSQGYTGDGGSPLTATLRNPGKAAVDGLGNVFVADSSNNVIRIVTPSTIQTYAGTGAAGATGDGGPAALATFRGPIGVALDASANLFIADTDNHAIRRIDAVTGILTKIAGTYAGGFSGDGGAAAAAQISTPKGLTLDSSSNLVFVDTGNKRIRRIDGTTGIITTIAGNGTDGYAGDGGPATAAVFRGATDVVADASNNFFIADTGNHIVRKIFTGTGTIFRIAGTAGSPGFSGDDSFATFARLNTPTSVAYDPFSENIYIGDQGNSRVRVVNVPTNIIRTLAGNGSPPAGGDGGPVALATFGSIFGMARDSRQNLYVADGYGQKIRRIDPSTLTINTIVGTGTAAYGGDGGLAALAQISTPTALFIDAVDNLFFADSENHRIRRVDATTGIITTVAGTGIPGYTDEVTPAVSTQLNYPKLLAGGPAATSTLFIGDTSNLRIRRLDQATGALTTVVGNGFAGAPLAGFPATVTSIGVASGLAVDASTSIHFADLGTSALWKVPADTGLVEPFSAAGPGYLNDAAPVTEAIFNYPSALTFDSCGNFVIADRANYRLRRTYGYGPARLPNYLNLDFKFTNYNNPNGMTTLSLNGSTLATFDAATLTNGSYQMTDSNILQYPLLSSNPVLGDQTPWFQITQTGSTGYIQLDGFAWAGQTPGQGLDTNRVNSDAGLIVNQGILTFPNRVNGITIDNKFNDLSTRTINYNGSLYSVSDPAFKEQIQDADLAACKSSLESLPLKSYRYKDAFACPLHIQDKHRLGFLTTDVEPVFPKSVSPSVPSADLGITTPFNVLDTAQIKFAHLGTTQQLLKDVAALEALVGILETLLHDLLRRRTTQRTSSIC